jgi:hypothetical protein
MSATSKQSSGSFLLRIFLASFLAGIGTPVHAQGDVLAPCLSCHEAPVLSSRIVTWDGEGRAERLNQYLSQHFAPEPAQREAIICELLESVEGAAADGAPCESP